MKVISISFINQAVVFKMIEIICSRVTYVLAFCEKHAKRSYSDHSWFIRLRCTLLWPNLDLSRLLLRWEIDLRHGLLCNPYPWEKMLDNLLLEIHKAQAGFSTPTKWKGGAESPTRPFEEFRQALHHAGTYDTAISATHNIQRLLTLYNFMSTLIGLLCKLIGREKTKPA